MRTILTIILFTSFLFAKDIKVATYNVENLFDGTNQGTEYPDFRLGKHSWSLAMAKKKLKNTIKAVKLINSDIIALQEIENKKILKTLAKQTGYKYTSFAKTSRAPVGIGVLSNYPIVYSESIPTNVRKTKDFLHVKIEFEKHILGLWVVHFPTQRFSIKDRKRVAYKLKKAVQKADDNEFLIVGDFNTNLSKKSILQQAFGTFNKAGNLYEPWFSLPSNKRWSHAYFNKKSALDRMLLSNTLMDGKNIELKKNSFRVLRESFLVNNKGLPNRWKTKGRKKEHMGKGYSDHLPLILTLTTSKQKQDIKNGNIDTIFSSPIGRANIKLEKVAVIYKNRKGTILGKDGRGVYAFKSGHEFKKGFLYDIAVKEIKDYKDMREIAVLEVLKEHGKVKDLTPYFFKSSNLKNARAGDVINSIEGEFQKGFLRTNYGNIRLFVKNNKKFKNGEHLKFERVRVGEFKNKIELIIENRE